MELVNEMSHAGKMWHELFNSNYSFFIYFNNFNNIILIIYINSLYLLKYNEITSTKWIAILQLVGGGGVGGDESPLDTAHL